MKKTPPNFERGFQNVLSFLKKHKDVLFRNPKLFQLSYKELDKIMNYNKPFIRKTFLSRLLGIERRIVRMNSIRKVLHEDAEESAARRRRNRPPTAKNSFRAPCGKTIWNSSKPSAMLEIRNWPTEDAVFLAPCYRPIQCIICMKEREDAYLVCLDVAAKNYWDGWVTKDAMFGNLPLPKVNNIRRLIVQYHNNGKKGERK